MYIVIIGAGEVGSYLARILIDEQHSVAIVESNEKLARRLDNELDALVVHGNGVSHETLEQAGIKRADLVLAVTHVDEVNLIVAMTAAKLSRAATVARVRHAEYLGGGSLDADELGLDLLVGPERAVASEVVKLLSYEGSGNIRHLAGGKIALLELPMSVDSPLCHETLAVLGDVFPEGSLVAAVSGPDGLRIPRGDDVLKSDERAYILTTPDNVDEFWILSGKPWHHVRHVLIVGCGNIGLHLAQELERQRMYPTIIEANRERAEFVSKVLTKSLVMHGDGTDPEFLREQLEERTDAVVVLLGDDEKSILVGLFARHLGAKKVIVRSEKSAYAPIAHRLGVDALLSPRRAVADEILRFVRQGEIASAIMLGDHEGELIQMKVPEAGSAIVGKPLREIRFPDGALLGAIVHEDKVVIGRGDTTIQPGDDVLVVAMPHAIHDVERLLS